jgi:hypothetical protein
MHNTLVWTCTVYLFYYCREYAFTSCTTHSFKHKQCIWSIIAGNMHSLHAQHINLNMNIVSGLLLQGICVHFMHNTFNWTWTVYLLHYYREYEFTSCTTHSFEHVQCMLYYYREYAVTSYTTHSFEHEQCICYIIAGNMCSLHAQHIHLNMNCVSVILLQGMSMDQVKQTMKMVRNVCQPKTGVSAGKRPEDSITTHTHLCERQLTVLLCLTVRHSSLHFTDKINFWTYTQINSSETLCSKI